MDPIDRRTFMELGAATLAAPHILRSKSARAGISDPAITVAGYLLDRTAALFDGSITIEGTRTSFSEAAIGELNTAAFSGKGKYDLTEIGLHPFILARANQGVRAYALLPIFLLRQFRHKSVFIRTDRGIASPADLKGRRVATPGYSSTSLTWIRGIFEDDYGLKPTDVEWVFSADDSSSEVAGKISPQESQYPKDLPISTGPAGMDESDLLVHGEVDALFHAATPRAYVEGNPVVSRLFPDFRTVEHDYFRRTGIFPIMHVLAIRRDAAAEHPWLAKAAFDAYSKAKLAAYRKKDRVTWATDMLPWYSQELEDTRALMGRNFYPYGIAGSRKAVETLFRYSFRQGLASRHLTIEEVFLPGSLKFIEEDA
jgi:4,5-dihydroxyphthalate decarboxylase